MIKERIEKSTFENCESLTTVTIGSKVNFIGMSAFRNCTALAKVYYKGTEEGWNSMTIGGSNSPLQDAEREYI